MNKEYSPAFIFDTREITKLKETFWGVENSIAETTEDSSEYYEVLNLLQEAKARMTFAEGKQFILDQLGKKRVSIGYRNEGELVAHTGLIIKPWGEVECGGSVVAEKYRGQSLMRGLNEKRRVLLEEFTSLGFQLTSYLVLGSRSVNYGAQLFDLPEKGLKTNYCNLGPYVYHRPNSVAEFDHSLLKDLSLKTSEGRLFTSTQILGIEHNNPPYLSERLLSQFSEKMKSFIVQFPMQNEIIENHEQLENDLHHSPAKIAVYVMRKPFSSTETLLNEISSHLDGGNNVIMRIPLTSMSGPALYQMSSVIGKEYMGFTMVPTGLGVVNNLWALTYASMRIDRLEHYKNMMAIVDTNYNSQLGHLAKYSLEALS